VIEKSIKQLPPEIYQVSGKELIQKLKSRRDHLISYATDYFLFLANDVQIIGSKKNEYFQITGLDSGKISLKAFAVNKDGERNETAFYSRTFYPGETKEIRLFGINGNDVYFIRGSTSPIKIRIIGGFDRDSVVQQESGNTIHIYDDKNNVFQTTKARLHLSSDNAIHKFDYDYFNYDKRGFKVTVFYNNDDRLFIGAGYGFTKHWWRREPYATKQFIGLNYSISQKAISSTYTALFPNVFDHWDFSLYANYDAVRWTNFFGLGNNTIVTTNDINYFRMRTREWLVNTGLAKKIGKSNLIFSAFFQSVKILSDSERYVAKIFLPINNDAFETNNYLGTLFTYTFSHVNDSIVPTKGFTFLGAASCFYNTSQKEFFQKYQGKLQAYFPLISNFSLAVRMGAATVSSTSDVLSSAEFYEHTVIGGPENLRGFKRERFWGKTSFYNNNELRFISDIRTHLLNTKVGVFVFLDDGKVWIPQQNADDFHTAYGGGILMAPFNKVCVNLTYGISKEARLFQVRLNKLF
jgi:hypothetical protein